MSLHKIPRDVLPTLVIGLGGTGFQVIKRLKQLFNKRFNNARIPVRYILIDTDVKSFLDDSVENNEKCQLRFGDGIKNTLDWAYRNANFDWLPKNPPITPDFFTSTDQGAGLVRPVGRLYLCKNAKLVYDTILSAKNDLVDLHKLLLDIGSEYLENIDRHKVYIVGSLAGGTGCGIFLDIGVMVSRIFNRDNTNVIGMFTMESCYDDKLSSDIDAQNRSKANCYAALKELEFYMSSVRNPEDEKYVFKYNNIGEIKLEKKLFDICYLLENKNEMGGVLTNIDDIYDLCSLQLFQEIGTPLGSQLRADYANFLCKDKDPVLNRERNFSTFSSSSLRFPFETLKSYSSLKLAWDILDKLGSGGRMNRPEMDEDKTALINKINNIVDFENITSDLTRPYRIRNDVRYSDLKSSKLYNLDRVGDSIRTQKNLWEQKKSSAVKAVKETIDSFIQSKAALCGIKETGLLLQEIENYFLEQKNQYVYEEKFEAGQIKSRFNNIDDRMIIKDRAEVPGDIIREFNGYLSQEYNNFVSKIAEDRYLLMRDIVKEMKDKLLLFQNNLDNMKHTIKSRLNSMSFSNEKRYGGNIISREVISKDYYEEVYNRIYAGSLQNKIAVLLKENSLMDRINSGVNEFVRFCSEDFVKTYPEKNIIDIFKENAEAKDIDANEYIKREMDIIAKLAKPFWSAVKNPEVSWTECYYVGSVRENSSESGFAVKPPEAVDRWIRNQTGERSRQARYVETQDPNSIDVIHIIMGACAAYLPDVRTYRQFYLRLLSSKIYPLHTNERFIGLPEIDPELDEILNIYSLSKAFGVIIEVEGSLFINIDADAVKPCYIYKSEFIIENDRFIGENTVILPETAAEIPVNLKLGSSYAEAINRVNQDMMLFNRIKDFVESVQINISKKEKKSHVIKYIKNRVSKDFIANEKIAQSILIS
ncbi:MAG: tubulin-like doman-containing protein [Bacillota bacterium]|nr:tubulin-like doman-containing protein [Bacillota bacterium]